MAANRISGSNRCGKSTRRCSRAGLLTNFKHWPANLLFLLLTNANRVCLFQAWQEHASVLASQACWRTCVSTNPDLSAALEEVFSSVSDCPFRSKKEYHFERGHLFGERYNRFRALTQEFGQKQGSSQGRNLALTALFVPRLPDSKSGSGGGLCDCSGAAAQRKGNHFHVP